MLNDAKVSELQHRAQTDLFYFATEILGYDLVPAVHRPVCDHFLQCNPNVPLYDLDACKNRLLLDPRGHFKTTIDICHTIQLIVCYPDIRILLVSGTQELAQRMLDECRRHFTHNERFRALFPAHRIDEENQGTAYEFTTPARKDWKKREPTLTISTIGSVKAGSHFEVIKFDDVVNEVNSETREQLQKTIDRFHATANLLDVPGHGYRDVIGTRYDHSDLYGWIIEHNEDNDWRIFKRAACSLPLCPDSTILFPFDSRGKPRFSYKILHKLWRENPRHFGCQQLNDPSFGETSSFSEELIRSAIVPIQLIPLLRKDPLDGQIYKASKVFIAWDLAFSKKKAADYTVGVVGCYDSQGRLFVIDMVRGRFDADELSNQLLSLIRKWYYFMGRVGIEDASGSQLLGPILRHKAMQMKMGLPIDWLPTRNDRTKSERIFSLLPLIKQKRLFISEELPFLQDFINEFVRFPRTRHDDIPDATSMLLHYQTSIDVVLPQHPIPVAQLAPIEPNPLGYGMVG